MDTSPRSIMADSTILNEQIRALYKEIDTYYSDASLDDEKCLHACEKLAQALLRHYFPEAQGYSIERSSMGPMAHCGLNFILAQEDGSDQVVQQQEASKKKKCARTQQQRDWIYLHGLKWESIKPENVSGFVVKRQVETTSSDTTSTESRPHTYLAIMVNLSNGTYDNAHSTANDVHRSDILADMLCREAEMQTGYGVLIYGPRIEFYAYDANRPWVQRDWHPKKGKKQMFTTPNYQGPGIDPTMSPISADDQGLSILSFDMRKDPLEAVDQAFKSIVALKVTYMTQIPPVNGDAEDTEMTDARTQGVVHEQVLPQPAPSSTHPNTIGDATQQLKVALAYQSNVLPRVSAGNRRKDSVGFILPPKSPAKTEQDAYISGHKHAPLGSYMTAGKIIKTEPKQSGAPVPYNRAPESHIPRQFQYQSPYQYPSTMTNNILDATVPWLQHASVPSAAPGIPFDPALDPTYSHSSASYDTQNTYSPALQQSTHPAHIGHSQGAFLSQGPPLSHDTAPHHFPTSQSSQFDQSYLPDDRHAATALLTLAGPGQESTSNHPYMPANPAVATPSNLQLPYVPSDASTQPTQSARPTAATEHPPLNILPPLPANFLRTDTDRRLDGQREGSGEDNDPACS